LYPPSCACLLGDLAQAEEVAQDALAQALERWSTEPPPRNPVAWVTATARNRALDLLRRARLALTIVTWQG
jgi:RNA polymerase sigma-70 factor (ECF subfamily)